MCLLCGKIQFVSKFSSSFQLVVEVLIFSVDNRQKKMKRIIVNRILILNQVLKIKIN